MNKNSTRYFSNKQEKHIAKELGGKQTANSGATPFYKVLTPCSFLYYSCYCSATTFR